MSWSPQQEDALKAVAAWLKRGEPQIFRLFGYAGAGKTTLARQLAEDTEGEVAFAAFTGKAALVLRSKGCKGARTIHSLIYRPREAEAESEDRRRPSFSTRTAPPRKREPHHHRRMLDGRRGARARSSLFRQAGAGARRSGATAAGSRRRLFHRSRARRHADRGAPPGRGQSDHPHVDDGARRRPARSRRLWRKPASSGRADIDAAAATASDQLLVGLNRTRRAYNRRMRELFGYVSEFPEPGDKLVCLRNDSDEGACSTAASGSSRPPRATRKKKLRHERRAGG